MTDTLTIEHVRAAQDNDLEAVAVVIRATDQQIEKAAAKAARRISMDGHRFHTYCDEFTQVARIAVWDAIGRFAGDSVDAFFGFVYRTVESVLLDAVRSETLGATGTDHDAIKVFASMLDQAGGDVYLAEKLSRTVPPKGRRLSADRANAARMAWQCTVSLDRPFFIATGDNYEWAYETTMNGVLASTIGIPEDLITADDVTREESRIKRAMVRRVLGDMGQMQRDVLCHSFGIAGATYYGHGADGDDEGLAEELGTTVAKVRDARSKGLKAFAKRWIKLVAKTEAEAKELTEAAAVNLSAGGRK
ncbi:sigma factor [Allostreptomyces psammosilenae]|uniref:Uncharacterized protein n=1 Tax=Allostreptomyces psammosilenae TaxID=1892865 RepID=A0A853A6J1_9ACTN|nr:sigma factor [Allostreptomyces psammosilenae]NYI06092.1 hypothetical protein [Allostreptomyces psammosilenae]